MGEGCLSQRVLRMQAIWSWRLGESKSFREVTVAWSCRGIWTYVVYVRDTNHWFLHKFNVDHVDTVQAFKATAPLMCPGIASLLNPTPASFHLPQQLRAFPFLNEDIIMDGRSRELPAYFARAGVSFKVDRMANLAAKKVD